ncbi:MAG TPA: MFS transporter, partial [Cellvibrio sp.]
MLDSVWPSIKPAASSFCGGFYALRLCIQHALAVAGANSTRFGGGILAALGYALIRTLFEPRLWARAIALVCGMWGVATLLGPALGGIFAEAGHWRLAFWALLPVLLFQTFVVVLKLSDEPPKSGAAELIPVRQIILLTASALAIAMAGQLESNSGRALALLLGIGLLMIALSPEIFVSYFLQIIHGHSPLIA